MRTTHRGLRQCPCSRDLTVSAYGKKNYKRNDQQYEQLNQSNSCLTLKNYIRLLTAIQSIKLYSCFEKLFQIIDNENTSVHYTLSYVKNNVYL